MRWILALVILLSASADELAAQAKGKGIRLWNLTSATISEFQLSSPGKNEWGPNQTLNDKDKEVDHDERLPPLPLDQRVDIAVEDGLDVGGREVSAVVCHHRVRLEDVRSNPAPPSFGDVIALDPRAFLGLLAQLQLDQLPAQDLHRRLTVLKL